MGEPSPKRSRAWIGYVLVTIAALLFSGVLTPPGPRAVPYDEAVKLVESGQVAAAVVSADEVVLQLAPQAGKEPQRVRTARLPATNDDPLVRSLLDKKVRLETQIARTPLWIQALIWIAPLFFI